jgi:RNA-directed DNA polymerase
MPRRVPHSGDEFLALLGDATGIAQGYSDQEIIVISEYIEKLSEQDLPVIFDNNHLALWSGLDSNFLYAASNAPKKFYRSYKIAKKSGGFRNIDEPLTDLKITQRWILDNILVKIPISAAAKAYRAGVSIRDGARLHLNRSCVVRIDFKDFFGSIRPKHVLEIYQSLGYSTLVSGLLTGLTTFNGRLPQGAPTSAAISNIFMREFDDRLLTFARGRGLRYSRYADDLTLSGDVVLNEILNVVSDALPPNIKINQKKTKTMRPGNRQTVSGIVVNKKPSAPREMRREVRQAVYFISKFGLGGHLAQNREIRSNYLGHLIGKVDFCIFCDPKNKEMINAKKFLENIKYEMV